MESDAQGRADGQELPSLRRLGTVVVVLLVVGVLCDVTASVIDYLELDLLERLIAGEDVAVDTLAASDDRTAVIALLQLLALLSTAVAFLVWFRRAYRNAPRMSTVLPRFGSGWAVGAWFVPFLNLWRPKQIANDIWRAGEPDPDPAVPFYARRVTPLLHVWWATWILANLLSGTIRFSAPETLEDQRSEAASAVAADVLGVVAGCLAIAVVVVMTERHEARRAQVAERAALTSQASPLSVL